MIHRFTQQNPKATVSLKNAGHGVDIAFRPLQVTAYEFSLYGEHGFLLELLGKDHAVVQSIRNNQALASIGERLPIDGNVPLAMSEDIPQLACVNHPRGWNLGEAVHMGVVAWKGAANPHAPLLHLIKKLTAYTKETGPGVIILGTEGLKRSFHIHPEHMGNVTAHGDRVFIEVSWLHQPQRLEKVVLVLGNHAEALALKGARQTALDFKPGNFQPEGSVLVRLREAHLEALKAANLS